MMPLGAPTSATVLSDTMLVILPRVASDTQSLTAWQAGH